jgi:hypothetical protein
VEDKVSTTAIFDYGRLWAEATTDECRRAVVDVVRAALRRQSLSQDTRPPGAPSTFSAHAYQHRRRPHSRVVYKFEPHAIVHYGMLSQAFPTTPWVFLYRQPLEVLWSFMSVKDEVLHKAGIYCVRNQARPLVGGWQETWEGGAVRESSVLYESVCACASKPWRGVRLQTLRVKCRAAISSQRWPFPSRSCSPPPLPKHRHCRQQQQQPRCTTFDYHHHYHHPNRPYHHSNRHPKAVHVEAFRLREPDLSVNLDDIEVQAVLRDYLSLEDFCGLHLEMLQQQALRATDIADAANANSGGRHQKIWVGRECAGAC